MKKPIALFVCLALSLPMPVSAGTVAGFGGSTEITQLSNNIQLGMSYIEQVETALNSARQYAIMLEQIKRNPADFAKGMLGGAIEAHLQNSGAALETMRSLESLRDRTQNVFGELRRAQAVLGSLDGQGIRITPGEYYSAFKQLAEQRGGQYRERFEAYTANLEGAREDIETINRLVERSDGMTSQIEGLSTVVASNGVIASLLLRQIEMTSAQGAMESLSAEEAAKREAEAVEVTRRSNEAGLRAIEIAFGIAPPSAE